VPIVLGLLCSLVGLFCSLVGLFCSLVGLFCVYIGLFCSLVGLFCSLVGLFCSLGLLCSLVGLFCVYIRSLLTPDTLTLRMRRKIRASHVTSSSASWREPRQLKNNFILEATKKKYTYHSRSLQGPGPYSQTSSL
jgi:hypothetical protein